MAIFIFTGGPVVSNKLLVYTHDDSMGQLCKLIKVCIFPAADLSCHLIGPWAGLLLWLSLMKKQVLNGWHMFIVCIKSEDNQSRLVEEMFLCFGRWLIFCLVLFMWNYCTQCLVSGPLHLSPGNQLVARIQHTVSYFHRIKHDQSWKTFNACPAPRGSSLSICSLRAVHSHHAVSWMNGSLPGMSNHVIRGSLSKPVSLLNDHTSRIKMHHCLSVHPCRQTWANL